MSARSSSSVSNSLAAFASSSSSGGSTFSFSLLDLDRGRAGRAVGQLELDLLGLARGGAGERALDLLDEPAGAELDDEVALPFACLVQRVHHEHVAGAGGSALDGCELRDRGAQLLELLVDQALGDLGLGVGHLELGPVGRLRLRLDGDGGRELEVLRRPRSASRSRTRARRSAGCAWSRRRS